MREMEEKKKTMAAAAAFSVFRRSFHAKAGMRERERERERERGRNETKRSLALCIRRWSEEQEEELSGLFSQTLLQHKLCFARYLSIDMAHSFTHSLWEQ